MFSSKNSITSFVLITIVISINIILSFTSSTVSGYFNEYQNNFPYDVMIKNLDKTEENYTFISELKGVSKVVTEYWKRFPVYIDNQKVRICSICDGQNLNGIIYENDVKNLESGTIIIDSLFANMHKYKIGDNISIKFDIDEPEYNFVIVGFCDSTIFNSSRQTIIFSKADYNSYISSYPAVYGVYLNNRVTIEEFMTEVSYKIYDETEEIARVFSKDAYLGEEIENTIHAINLVSFIPIIGVVLAIFGYVSNQIITYYRKRREYAVLHTIAMNSKELTLLVILEMMMVFIIGCILAVFVSFWSMIILKDIIYEVIAYVNLKFDYKMISVLLLGSLGLLLISSVIPSKLIKKMNVVEVIQYD